MDLKNLSQTGITFVELVIVLVILFFIILFAFPSFQTINNRALADASMAKLFSSLEFARQQAIIHNISVDVCPSNDGRHCQGNWRDGLVIFLDPSGDGQLQNPQQILRIVNFDAHIGKIVWNREETLIQMSPSGRLKSQNGTFYYYFLPSDSKAAITVVLSSTGRIRLDNEGNCSAGSRI